MAVILGYARVSSTGQDLDAQLAALAAAGVDDERVYTDKLSGAANTDRPGLAALLDYARADDIVLVTAIDRLGRSVAEVTRTIADLNEQRIVLRAMREESTRPPRQAALSPPSWLRWPNSNSNSVANAAQLLVNHGGFADCQPLSRPSSAPNGRSNCDDLRPPANQWVSWRPRSGWVEPRRTATLLLPLPMQHNAE